MCRVLHHSALGHPCAPFTITDQFGKKIIDLTTVLGRVLEKMKKTKTDRRRFLVNGSEPQVARFFSIHIYLCGRCRSTIMLHIIINKRQRNFTTPTLFRAMLCAQSCCASPRLHFCILPTISTPIFTLLSKC